MDRKFRLLCVAVVCVAASSSIAAPRKPTTGGSLYAASQGTTSGDSAVYAVSATGISVLVEEIGQPQKMAWAIDGSLLVTDVAGDSGDLIWRLQRSGVIAPYFIFSGEGRANPYGIAVAGDSTVYVTATASISPPMDRVVAISTAGDSASLAIFDGSSFSLARTSQGELLVANSYFSIHRILRVSSSGAVSVLTDGLPAQPRDAQIGPDGALYIAIPQTNQIYRWDLSSSSPVLSTYADVDQPLSLAFDGAGFLYVGQNGGKVSRVDQQGNILLIASGFRGDPITGIAVSCTTVPKGKPKPCISVRKTLSGP